MSPRPIRAKRPSFQLTTHHAKSAIKTINNNGGTNSNNSTKFSVINSRTAVMVSKTTDNEFVRKSTNDSTHCANGSLGKSVPALSICFFTPISIHHFIVTGKRTDNSSSDDNSNQLARIIDNRKWCLMFSHWFKQIIQQRIRMHSRNICSKDILQTFVFLGCACCLISCNIAKQFLFFINDASRRNAIFFH